MTMTRAEDGSPSVPPAEQEIELPVLVPDSLRSASLLSSAMPEDAARLLVDYATSSLLELLALALVDKQFHHLARGRFAGELAYYQEGLGDSSTASLPSRPRSGLSQLLLPQVAQFFVALPDLLLKSPCASCEEQPSHSPWTMFGEDEALLHCKVCSTPILKADDVISNNYRIMTGRAYLTRAAHNIAISEDTHEAHYTTGQYTVKNVSCATCSLRLGITYVSTTDPDNRYKIGKMLVGQYLFVRPACCMLRSGRLPSELPTPLCVRCQRTAARNVLRLVQMMTKDLSIGHTRQLYELLLRQQALESITEPPAQSTRRRRMLAGTRALVSWCLPLLRGSLSMRSRASPEKEVAFKRLSRAGVEASQLLSSSSGELWQECVKERVRMLSCLAPSLQVEAIGGAFSSIVRFLGAVSRIARSAAPEGCSWPERVPLLLEVLPFLIAPQVGDALKWARALVLAVRREWANTAGSHGSGGGALTTGELEDVVNAITARAAVCLAESIKSSRVHPRSLKPGHRRSPLDASRGRLLEKPETTPRDAETPLLQKSSDTSPQVEDCKDFTLQCFTCGTAIVKADAVLSTEYWIRMCPGYLVSAASNLAFTAPAYEATYATGSYTVRDVVCRCCTAKHGITYLAAAEPQNQHKVGKFLLGQDHLVQAAPALASPRDQAALRGQLLELLQSSGPGPAPVQPHTEEALPAEAALPRPAEAQERHELRASTRALPSAPSSVSMPQNQQQVPLLPAPPPRRLVVSIKRYFRCILPTVYYVPAVSSLGHAVTTVHRPAHVVTRQSQAPFRFV